MTDAVKAVAASTAALLALLLLALPLVFLSAPPPGFVESFLFTAAASAAAAGGSLLPGLAVAMAARRGGAWGALGMVLYVPALVPPTSVGVLLLAAFSTPRLLCGDCPLSQFVSAWVVNQPLGVLLAMWVMALPVAYSIYDGALREERAEAFFRSLGFSGLRLLVLTAMSLREATLSAALFAWLRGFGELGVLLVFANYPYAASIYIYNAWLIYGVGPAIGASLAVVAAALAVGYAARRWLSR